MSVAALSIHAAAPEAPVDPLAEALALLRDIRDALAVRRLDDRLALDAVELAEALGVSERSIWTLHSSGELPAPFKAGSRTLWDLADLRKWMEAGRPRREEWERQKGRRK
jgi:predicted DNA-binding transcriptional regulator AlpA